MTTFEKTIKAIQVAVPEILELKRGCKYLFTDLTASKGYVKQREKICDSGNYKIENGIGYFMSNAQWLKMDKIIGRDITLFDIRQIFKQNNDFGSCNLVLKLWDMWNDEDNFEKQSQETKDFIGDLIL